ncbi:hypothetical protein LTR95_013721 [Oleoguttula sp. CCFEE 5521]
MHLEYILTELLKNSFRATIEAGMEKEPIDITIAPAPENEDWRVEQKRAMENGRSVAKRVARHHNDPIDTTLDTHPSISMIQPLDCSSPGVTIRIRDRGGGISPENHTKLWEYGFTTFNEDEINDKTSGSDAGPSALDMLSTGAAGGSSLAGLGYGLPLGRAYAEYFGGGIAVQSLFGWGTDVYLSLRGVGSREMDNLMRRLRLGGKDASQSDRNDSMSSPSTLSYEKITTSPFLALPPELRNAVYERLADITPLTLVISKKRRPKQSHAVTGLLLVCKQTFREYQPVLLANAPITFDITKFDFTALAIKLEALSEDTVNALAANQQLCITLAMSHTLRPAEIEGLARWLEYKQGNYSGTTPASTAPQRYPAHTLRFNYNAVVDPPRSLASAQNTKVALVTALLRQLARLGGRSDKSEERQRMMRDLARCKDALMGVHRTAEEHESEIGGLAAAPPRAFSGVQWTPQYR